MPRHIAILTPGFPSDESDTPCIPALQDYVRGVQTFAPELALSVLTLRYPHVKGRYRWHGLDVFASNGRQLRYPASVPSWLRLARNFVRVNKSRKVDLLHSFFLSDCTLLGTMLSRYYEVPHVITLMGRDLQQKSPYRRLLDRSANVVVCVSPFQANDLTGQQHNVAPGALES